MDQKDRRLKGQECGKNNPRIKIPVITGILFLLKFINFEYHY